MASTYSTNLAIELIGTGEQSGTWGTTTNTNLGTLLEQAISGVVTQSITDGADTTITIPNGASGVARNMYIEMTGALTATRNLIVPANKKLYFIFNNTTGGFAVTVKVTGQAGVSVPSLAKMILVMNSAGTDIVSAVSYFAALSAGSATLTTPLAVTSGGTGAATVPVNSVIIGNPGGTAYSSVAPVTNGNVLTVAGGVWTSASAFVTGMIILWSGSSASIPSGWLLCNGSSSTPDLRDRFVVGAGSTYAVNATGGSANAITVTHTHTVTDPGHFHSGTPVYTYPTSTNGASSGGFWRTDSAAVANVSTEVTGISIASAGSSGTNANLPPYYALCYIMKT